MRIRPAHWLAGLLALAVLLGVFSLYTRSQFMVDLAGMVWACFQ